MKRLWSWKLSSGVSLSRGMNYMSPAKTESHPGHGGVNRRWDEIEGMLKEGREDIPDNARRARAETESINRRRRYEPSGPDYKLRWLIL